MTVSKFIFLFLTLSIFISLALSGCSQNATPIITATAGLPSYTLTEVAAHNTQSDCWMVINDMVIDVTSYIPDHSGGNRILEGCGKDATVLFDSFGNHVGTAVGLLITYQIGFLAK